MPPHRKTDAAYLERVALWYLERYAASEAGALQAVLQGRGRATVVAG